MRCYNHNMKKVLSAILTLIILSASINVFASSEAIENSLDTASDNLIMNKSSIDIWNSQNDDINIGYTISKNELINKIDSLSIISFSKRFIKTDDKKLFEADTHYYNKLIENINYNNIETENIVEYGIILARTPLKTWPTMDEAFSNQSSAYDRFLESTLYPYEPIAILHESKDKKWLFVKMYNYEGWVQKEDVAYTSFNILNLLINNHNFIVITEPKAYLKYSNRELDMGCTFPLLNKNSEYFTVLCPQKRADNSLYFTFGYIPIEYGSINYLPYTQKNTLSQAYKFIDEPYGWGGMNGYRDCSALVMDIYRSMGIKLKRNTDQQEIMSPINISVSEISESDKRKQLKTLPAGSLIFMNGHVMLYIGEYENTHYILHDTPGYYDDYGYHPINSVTVTEVDIRNSQGNTYISQFTTFLYISEKDTE